ncbi:sensor histidine kinase [Variovorax sp. RA8]|uniref:sensor histidine kinase n=1 Tax=Variovorax sp. (strain JCM 16519 / RA8) TaxID=662548 RepID=UPI0013165243|nr:HAMP domain-containing sensor histidine kinase [Variovorax sp. RA8]VTU19510.1 Bacteriophytochrome [Variovorax sp. RA8]
MKLSRFLTERAEEILVEWEAFAKTLEPAAALMTSAALRDHAHLIIKAFALDIENSQSKAEQTAKSHGDSPGKFPQSAASIHGTLREVSGFSLVQLTAEFRALRASVLRIWLPSISEFNQEVHEELVRFNEAVDQALAESAVTFSEHNNQTRERFLAILGHDLRTPLAAVSMTGSLLERSSSVEGNAAIGKRLLRSAATMSTMVNDLLEYSRTQLGGKMPMAPVPADMRDIVQAALHNAASAHPDCIFELHLRGDLSGVFDDVRLQQVVVNLLANAAQYRAKGTNVKLDVSGELNDVLLSVTNFGPAIPPESLKTIFSAMVQLPVDGEQPGRPRTSLGLGLFIARETALAHGGSIDVSSTDADGTTFTVRIPRAIAPPKAPVAPAT